jgi:hypothetical protein
MQPGNRTTMPIRLNWRFLIGQFFTIVVGVLVALWVDQVRAAGAGAALEVEPGKCRVATKRGSRAARPPRAAPGCWWVARGRGNPAIRVDEEAGHQRAEQHIEVQP